MVLRDRSIQARDSVICWQDCFGLYVFRVIIPGVVINMVFYHWYTSIMNGHGALGGVLCGAELNILIDYISIALNVNGVWLLFFI